MMKHIFSLLVLLHLCSSTEIDINLNLEVIERLKELHSLKTINITSPVPLHVPVADKHTHVSCLGAFAKELKHVLDYMTVPQEKEYIRAQLRLNLQTLGQVYRQQTGHKCVFVPIRNTSMVLKRYMTFLRILNNSGKENTSA